MAPVILPRQVMPSRGFFWISEGFSLLFNSPIGWLAVTFLTLSYSLFCMLIWGIGPTLFSLTLPVIFGGLMVGAQAVAQGRSIRPGHLLEGFRRHFGPLIIVGGVNLAVDLLLTVIMVLWGGNHVVELQQLVTASQNSTVKETDLQVMVTALTPMLMAITLLQLVLLMMGWFTPSLVVFQEVKPFAALNLSGKAFFKNFLAFIAFTMGIGTLASMIFWLGLVAPPLGAFAGLWLLALIPASVYCSYRDVFSPVNDLNAQWHRVD
jgi:hypothetical protein